MRSVLAEVTGFLLGRAAAYPNVDDARHSALATLPVVRTREGRHSLRAEGVDLPALRAMRPARRSSKAERGNTRVFGPRFTRSS